MKIDGKKVRELRRSAGLSSLQLAEGICPNAMLFQIEENRALVSEEVVARIAERLGVPVTEINPK